MVLCSGSYCDCVCQEHGVIKRGTVRLLCWLFKRALWLAVVVFVTLCVSGTWHDQTWYCQAVVGLVEESIVTSSGSFCDFVCVRNMAWSNVAWQLDFSNTRRSSLSAVWTHSARHRERMWCPHETTRPRRTAVLYGQLVGTASHPAALTWLQLTAVLYGHRVAIFVLFSLLVKL